MDPFPSLTGVSCDQLDHDDRDAFTHTNKIWTKLKKEIHSSLKARSYLLLACLISCWIHVQVYYQKLPSQKSQVYGITYFCLVKSSPALSLPYTVVYVYIWNPNGWQNEAAQEMFHVAKKLRACEKKESATFETIR